MYKGEVVSVHLSTRLYFSLWKLLSEFRLNLLLGVYTLISFVLYWSSIIPSSLSIFFFFFFF